MIRQDEDNYILKYRQLFHQYIVDMYAKIESERLLFIRLNQTKLRSEQYIHLRDAVVNDGNTTNVGRLTILHSSYAVPVICMNMLKMLLRMFVSMVVQIYLLHLHVINLGTRYSSFYFKDNRRFIDMTLRPVSSGKS